jgi:hypothetical protein
MQLSPTINSSLIGLKYEDLLLENDDLEKALSRIPKSVKVQRFVSQCDTIYFAIS